MSKRLSLIGNRYGKLIVIDFSHTENGYSYWKCKCDCGNVKIIRGTYLTQKRRAVKSCGCLIKEKAPDNLPKHKCITHNMTGTKFYGVWNSMVMRCHNPESLSYKRYGAKGINVCNRWRKFENFYCDMFPSYKEGLTIDRIDNSKGYSPENCRWVDMKVQCNNKTSNHTIIYENKEYTLSQASEKFSISYHTLKRRIYNGWSVKKAIETPVKRRKKHEL